MKLKSILNSKERRIHREAHSFIDNVMIGARKDDGKVQLSRDNIYTLSSEYVKLYQSLNSEKTKSGLTDTHSLLTKFALMITGKNPEDPAYYNLIDSSTGPDRHIKSIALMMEGHFYGSIGWNRTGNYMKRVFSEHVLKLIDVFNDVDETAISNYTMHITNYDTNHTHESLAWALHYLQDLTAPHHAGNYAIFFSKYTDGFDTHHGFEKKAREIINKSDNIKKITDAAEKLLPEICDEFRKKTPDEFAGFIYSESLKNIDDSIKSKNPDKWIPVINKALPLGVAASAAVLKSKL